MPTQMVARDAATLNACKSSKLKLANVRWTALGLLPGPRPAGGVATAPLVSADPTDPHARVASVGHRPPIAPHVIIRPASPRGRKDQNRRVAPPKNEQ